MVTKRTRPTVSKINSLRKELDDRDLGISIVEEDLKRMASDRDSWRGNFHKKSIELSTTQLNLQKSENRLKQLAWDKEALDYQWTQASAEINTAHQILNSLGVPRYEDGTEDKTLPLVIRIGLLNVRGVK